MELKPADAAIHFCLTELGKRYEEAAALAKAALACAATGNLEKAVHIAMDIEQPSYEGSRLLDAASLLNRLNKCE